MVKTRNEPVPDDVYIPFVETLFRDGFTLFIGFSTQLILISLVWWKTGNPAYLAVVLCLLTVAVARLRNMRKYAALPPAATREEARERLHPVRLATWCGTGDVLSRRHLYGR
jgi:hypothetical protein